MSIYKQNRDFYDGIIQLDKDEQQNPGEVISQFFADMHLHEIRELIHKMKTTCLIQDSEFVSRGEKETIDFFCETLERVVEASLLISHKASNRED